MICIRSQANMFYIFSCYASVIFLKCCESINFRTVHYVSYIAWEYTIVNIIQFVCLVIYKYIINILHLHVLTQLSFSQVTFYSSADFVYKISHKMRVQSTASIKNPMIELGINILSSFQKDNHRGCTHVVKMCSISSGNLKIGIVSHNLYINL